jgi:hypothetical protein
MDLRREFSNSGPSAKSLVKRLLRRVGKGRNAAQEAPVTVFKDARGPNVRMLRQAQRRLSPAELEALIAEYEAGARVCELAKVYDLHRTTVAKHVARAGKTRPGMTGARLMRRSVCIGTGEPPLGAGRLRVPVPAPRRPVHDRSVVVVEPPGRLAGPPRSTPADASTSPRCLANRVPSLAVLAPRSLTHHRVMRERRSMLFLRRVVAWRLLAGWSFAQARLSRLGSTLREFRSSLSCGHGRSS